MRHVSRELQKILAQKRTFFGWVGLFLVPFIITAAVRLQHHPGRGGGNQQGPDFFFNLITTNGLYVVIGAIAALVAFLLPLLSSMAGSQTIAGEAENGTLRTVLMQPVRRGTVLLAKWLVANLYIAVGLVVLAAGAFIAGGAVFGVHPMLLTTGQTVSVAHSLWLLLLAYLFAWVGMAAVVSLGLALSTLTNSALAAMGAAMGLVVIMLILGGLSVFDFLHPYVFTSHFDALLNFFQQPIDWVPIRNGLINFVVWIVGMTGIAWLIFRRKDILS